MAFFKFLVSAVLATTSLPAEGEDGWFSVAKVQTVREQGAEEDASIWVLFIKSVGNEKFQVRFPEEPSYRTNEAGHLEIRSYKDGEVFEVTVLQEAPTQVLEGPQQVDGWWVQEKIVQSKDHIFSLKTFSHNQNGLNHKEFISSFLVEAN